MTPARTRRGWDWWVPQVALVAAVLAGLAMLAGGVGATAFPSSGGDGGLFLRQSARFPIAESILPFVPSDPIGWAIVVGLGNTVALTIAVILFSTLLGVPLALARRSRHMLASSVAGAAIELLRHTPLVVQLLFWYGLITVSLPSPRDEWQPLGGVFLTDRGIHFTALGINGAALSLVLLVATGLIVTLTQAWRGRLHRASVTTLATAVSAGLLWVMLDLGLACDVPRLGRYDFTGGWTISPELFAALAGLSVYAAAFTAEIVRGGIAAVPRAQWEAGATLGLHPRQTLRLIVAPQAMHLILPPLTSHFIAILKNSTLALIIGLPELNMVTTTIVNHSGRAIEGAVWLMAAFLALAVCISGAMHAIELRLRWGRA